jgi:Ras-related protein Rab-11A
MLIDRIAEIYRIVSSKALDTGESGQNPLGERRQVVEISKSQDAETKQGCC